jgi:hypothetical protein
MTDLGSLFDPAPARPPIAEHVTAAMNILRGLPDLEPATSVHFDHVRWDDGPSLVTAVAELTRHGFAQIPDYHAGDEYAEVMVTAPSGEVLTLQRRITVQSMFMLCLRAARPGRNLLPAPDLPATGLRPRTGAEEVAWSLVQETLPGACWPTVEQLCDVIDAVDEHHGGFATLREVGRLAARDS